MANDTVALQWNCCGLKHKRDELELLIAKFSPPVICLQETLLSANIETLQKEGKALPSVYNFKGYTPYFKCKETGRNGVGLYVKNSIFHSQIKLKTQLQALAVRVTLHNKVFIVCSHYTPPSENPTIEQFQNLYDQFDKPPIMCGDFNAHNTLWSHPADDERGKVLEDFMFNNDLALLNTTIKTHGDALLDLTIIHPALFLDFDCHVLNDNHRSDHQPIIIKFSG